MLALWCVYQSACKVASYLLGAIVSVLKALGTRVGAHGDRPGEGKGRAFYRETACRNSYMGAPLSLGKYAVQRAAANSSVHPQPSSSHASRKRRHLLEPPPLSSLTRAVLLRADLVDPGARVDLREECLRMASDSSSTATRALRPLRLPGMWVRRWRQRLGVRLRAAGEARAHMYVFAPSWRRGTSRFPEAPCFVGS